LHYCHCRHTFAGLLTAQCLDLVFISRQLGHAKPATTMRSYALRQAQPRQQDA
jgi:integrase